MKRFSLISCLLFIFNYNAMLAQAFVYYQAVSKTDVHLRDSVTVLARIDVFIPAAGDMVLHFDGVCYSSPGDRIILAANNGPFWLVSYGHTEVETTDENIGKSFSVSRTLNWYEVDAGKVHSIYAVGHNFGHQSGSGHASIYGILTAEYLPYSGTAHVWAGGNQFIGDVTNPTVVTTESAYAYSEGKVIVRFDGWCTSDVGDRIVLAASNTNDWSPDDGNVAVEATSGTINVNAFCHTREYAVAEVGFHPYYGVVQNYVETDGNGMAGVYGSLHTEFYPNSGSTLVAFQGFSQPHVDLNDQFVTLTSVSLDSPGPGVVLVDFDGNMTSDPGDFIELGASDNLILLTNDGNVTLQAIDDDLNLNCFAHTRVYTVDAGHHTYYALGKSFSGDPGSGIANIYGELMARYYPDPSTAVQDVSATPEEMIVWPNPTTGPISISFNRDIHADKTIQLLDESGSLVKNCKRYDAKDMALDLSSLPDGLYYIASGNSVKRIVKVR